MVDFVELELLLDWVLEISLKTDLENYRKLYKPNFPFSGSWTAHQQPWALQIKERWKYKSCWVFPESLNFIVRNKIEWRKWKILQIYIFCPIIWLHFLKKSIFRLWNYVFCRPGLAIFNLFGSINLLTGKPRAFILRTTPHAVLIFYGLNGSQNLRT